MFADPVAPNIVLNGKCKSPTIAVPSSPDGDTNRDCVKFVAAVIPVNCEPSPTNEPLNVEPDIDVAFVKSTPDQDKVNDPVISASPVYGKVDPPPPPAANEADVNIPPPIDAVSIDIVPLELILPDAVIGWVNVIESPTIIGDNPSNRPNEPVKVKEAFGFDH